MYDKRSFKKIIPLAAFGLSILFVSSFCLAAGPKYGGTLRIGVRVPQFTRLDARALTTETMVPSATMIYDYLYGFSDKGLRELVPALATKIETHDNKVWLIHLRRGVKFHNGREMTAQDVKANFDWRIQTPKGWKPVRYKELIKYLKKAEVLDKYTVKVTLEKPFAPLIRVLAYSMRGIIPPEEAEKWKDKFTFHPCGTGPFKVVEIKPKERVVLGRFEDYWGPRPYVDKVVYKFYRSNEARLVALQKGELDIAPLFDEAKPVLDRDPNLSYHEVVNPTVLHKFYFNMRRWPMNDIRFRKAVWMGADWRNIAVNSFPFQSGNFARTFLDYTKYFNPDAVGLVPSYNPQEAKKLIEAVEKDAGKKIPPIYWLDSSWAPGKATAEVAKVQLAQIGVPLNLQLLSHAIWFDKILRDPKIEWDMAGYGAGFGVAACLGFRYFETDSATAPDGKSLGGYASPEFDKWILRSEAALNEPDRLSCYYEAEKVLIRDAAAIPLFIFRMLIAYNKSVKGLVATDTGNIYVTNTWTNVWLNR
ncbi:MAG: ABC transporter substrate-binding protein [Deltaproteobacteria bacterium]|nr:ABC transporter substrate-binding protein [Deltaproteobacteria bacterium]MBW2138868.1 ABC transporter substrate-binding protein [Deltaproteobacteria bacterium]